MRAFATLLGKERREHAAFLTSLNLAIALLVALVLLALTKQDAAASAVELAASLQLFIGLVAFIAAHRLFAKEYATGTAGFLDALPTSRTVVLAAKLTTLAAWTTAAAGLQLAIARGWDALREIEPLVPPSVVAVRSGLLCAFFVAAAALFGALGRYRFPSLFALGALALHVESLKRVGLSDYGPLRLLSAVESASPALPGARVVAQTLIPALLMLSAAVALALARDGALLSRLAQPATRKERTIWAFLALGVLQVLAKFPPRATADPYPNQDALELAERVFISAEDPTRHEALGREVAAVRRTLRDALGLAAEQRVLLEETTSSDHPIDFVRYEDALVFRVDFDSPRFVPLDLTAYVAHVAMNEATQQRGGSDERLHWLMDGVASLPGAITTDGALPPALALRVAYCAQGMEERQLDLRTHRERPDAFVRDLGEDCGMAIAGFMLTLMAEGDRRACVAAVARDWLTKPPREGLWGFASLRLRGPLWALGRCGVDADALDRTAKERLAELQRRHAGVLSKAAFIAMSATPVTESDGARYIELVTGASDSAEVSFGVIDARAPMQNTPGFTRTSLGSLRTGAQGARLGPFPPEALIAVEIEAFEPSVKQLITSGRTLVELP